MCSCSRRPYFDRFRLVISLIGLLLMGIIIDLGLFNLLNSIASLMQFRQGGNPKHDRIGFRYWQHPHGPMGHYLLSVVKNEHLSIFLGFWATLTNALFAFILSFYFVHSTSDPDIFPLLNRAPSSSE